MGKLRHRGAEAAQQHGLAGAGLRVPRALDDTVFHGHSSEDRLLLGRPAAFSVE